VSAAYTTVRDSATSTSNRLCRTTPTARQQTAATVNRKSTACGVGMNATGPVNTTAATNQAA
jgi:hypothetical protein